MYRQKFGADRGRAFGRASNGIRNIVKLEVEENVFAERAQGLNDLWAGCGEKLAPDLIEFARIT
jgi:hypothetical protein